VKPDVTAIVPTRNRRALLQRTLRTVLNQRDVALEVIVVDDGSTEDAQPVIEALGDVRLRLLRHDNPTGVSIARNHGAEAARGEWLAFCDDDDLWAPDKLSRQLAAARTAGRRWCYGGAVNIDVNQRIISGMAAPAPDRMRAVLPRWNQMPGGSSNVIVEREMFRDAGAWDPTLVNLADWDLWIRLSRLGEPASVGRPLVGYRIHSGNASSNTALTLHEASLIERRYGVRVDYGAIHYYLGWVALRSGRRRVAATHFAQSALRGSIGAVAGTAADILRARVRRLFTDVTPRHGDREWCQDAEQWLAELNGARPCNIRSEQRDE
jgi:glycosyltransferase involved in cell wall biosynthesis